MSEVAIRVENLSKRYQIGAKKSGSFRETLANAFRRRTEAEAETTEFWALKDVSFDIKRGEAVGIIGKNGAGKSTLLKVLSRITEPTRGRIEINGRVASLLEVGTGFHPELTGRENIFMNGTILGMTRREIRSKLDEIIDFSGVEKFIDTSVKRYSSGMYVRLAFAVAAHLEPEILIIDEVLAVGDAEFQKKCLGKMGEVAGQGRTVIFVSHSMEAVQKLCNKGILLQRGEARVYDNVEGAIKKYLELGSINRAVFNIADPPNKEELLGYTFQILIENLEGQLINEIPVGRSWQVKILFKLNTFVEHLIIGLGILSPFELSLWTSWSEPQDCGAGVYQVIFRNKEIIFTPGVYPLVIGLSKNKRTFHNVEKTASLQISEVSDLIYDKRIVNVHSGLIVNPMESEICLLSEKMEIK